MLSMLVMHKKKGKKIKNISCILILTVGLRVNYSSSLEINLATTSDILVLLLIYVNSIIIIANNTYKVY